VNDSNLNYIFIRSEVIYFVPAL